MKALKETRRRNFDNESHDSRRRGWFPARSLDQTRAQADGPHSEQAGDGIHRRDACKNGFKEIMVNLYHLGDQIEDYFKDGADGGSRFTTPLKISSGEMPAASSDARISSMRIHSWSSAGMTWRMWTSPASCDFHRDKKALATIALSEVEDPSQYGIACLDDSARITEFLEKPTGVDVPSRKANTGIYLFDRRVLDLIPPGVFYGLGRQLCPLLIEQRGRVPWLPDIELLERRGLPRGVSGRRTMTPWTAKSASSCRSRKPAMACG